MKKELLIKTSQEDYKRYTIAYNFHAKNEYTVYYQGDDLVFDTIEEAKKFIDEIETQSY